MKNIIVAIDEQNPVELNKKLERLLPHFSYFKIGLEAYYAHGNQLIEKIKNQNKNIFLDLKLHDIPNTMKKSIQVLDQLNVDMINVHALAGQEALMACRDTVKNAKLIAVTILTSMEQQNLIQLGMTLPLRQQVLKLAQISFKTGLDGVVCSALEAQSIKTNTNKNFLTVTPGIRLDKTHHHDQKRVMSPKEALSAGADYLVMGREITESKDLEETLFKIKEQIYANYNRQNTFETQNVSN